MAWQTQIRYRSDVVVQRAGRFGFEGYVDAGWKPPPQIDEMFVDLTVGQRFPRVESVARTAIVRSLSDMKDTLTVLVDVRSCAARHPWIVTGSAVTAGVVAGALLTPSRRKRHRSRQETASRSEAEARPSGREKETPRTAKSFLFSIAGTVLTNVLPPLLQSCFASTVATKGEPRADAPSSRDSVRTVASEKELIETHRRPAFSVENATKEKNMLWTLCVILAILWLLGMLTSYTAGGLIHILLAVALIVVVIRVIQGRRVA